jgi:hypothetical protein
MMDEKIHPSSLPAGVACPSFWAPTDTPHEQDSGPANEGRACHDVSAYVPLGKEPDIESIARKWAVTTAVIGPAHHFAKQAWEEVGKYFPDPLVEFKVENDLFTGRIDVLQAVKALAVGDWKSGWGQFSHIEQLMGYADCARSMWGMPECGYVVGVEIWLRHQEYQVHQFDEDRLDGFRAKVIEKRKQIGKAVPFEPQAMTDEKLGEAYDKVRMIEQALRQFHKLVDERLAKGALPLPNGRELVLEEQNRDSISAKAAWSVIVDGVHPLGPDELDAVLKVSKTKLLDAVAKQAPPRKGAAYKRETLAELREAGAIKSNVTKRKKVRKSNG